MGAIIMKKLILDDSVVQIDADIKLPLNREFTTEQREHAYYSLGADLLIGFCKDGEDTLYRKFRYGGRIKEIH